MSRAIGIAAFCTVGLVTGCTGSLTLWNSPWAAPLAGALAVSALISTIVFLALYSRRLFPILGEPPPIAPVGGEIWPGRWEATE